MKKRADNFLRHRPSMPNLKIQFHVHTGQDPVDRPFHTEKEMIDAAAQHQYDIVVITCHNKLVFSDELKNYAAQKGILLIPGIEKNIEKRHVLIMNALPETEKIHTFDDLTKYKKQNPDCLVIAPHPYYFTHFCLKEKFDQHHELFDAVEYSWYHTEHLNHWNKKAEEKAKKYNLPIIATSDNHILSYFDAQYSLIDAAEKTWPEIKKAILAKKIIPKRNPLDLFEFLIVTIRMIAEFNIRNMFQRKKSRHFFRSHQTNNFQHFPNVEDPHQEEAMHPFESSSGQ